MEPAGATSPAESPDADRAAQGLDAAAGSPQGERAPSARGPLAVLAAGAIVVLALLGAGAFLLLASGDDDGLGNGAVAVVEEAPDGSVSAEELERATAQTASLQGLEPVPAEGTEERAALDETALADLILARWIRGEAAERGVEASEEEVDAEMERVIEREFEGEESGFERYLSDNGFSEQEARDRVELLLLSDRIQADILAEEEGDARTEAVTAFQEEFFARWRERTICAEELAVDRCSNGPEPPDLGDGPPPPPPPPEE